MLPSLYSRPRTLSPHRLLIRDRQILLIMQNLRLLHLPRQMFTLSVHELSFPRFTNVYVAHLIPSQILLNTSPTKSKSLNYHELLYTRMCDLAHLIPHLRAETTPPPPTMPVLP